MYKALHTGVLVQQQESLQGFEDIKGNMILQLPTRSRYNIAVCTSYLLQAGVENSCRITW